MSAQIFYNNGSSSSEIITHLVNASDGQGLHFDGTSGTIDIASPPDLGTKFSFEFIIQADDWPPTSGTHAYLVDFSNGGRFIFGTSTSDVANNLAIHSVSGWASFGVKVLDDLKVHHLVMTVDGTAATLYDNGNQVGTATITAPNIDSCSDAAIGSSGGGQYFNGTFYRCRFWNKTLSSTDVTSVYESASINFADQWGSQTIVIPGDFNGNLDGWDASNNWNSQTNPSNNMVLAASAADQICRTSITLTKGKRYRCTYTASGLTGSPQFANYTTAIPTDSGSTTITAGTNSFEFVFQAAYNSYFYIRATGATDAVTLDDVSVVEVGCVADFDLAFANPTQSAIVQNRNDTVSMDGTAAGGVTQISPIEQLNSKALSVGTVASSPADGSIVASGLVGVADSTYSASLYANYTGGIAGVNINAASNGFAIWDNTVERFKIDSAGKAEITATGNGDWAIKAANTHANGSGALIVAGGSASTDVALEVKHSTNTTALKIDGTGLATFSAGINVSAGDLGVGTTNPDAGTNAPTSRSSVGKLNTYTGVTAEIADSGTLDIPLTMAKGLMAYLVESNGNSNYMSAGFFRSNNNGASSSFTLFGQSENSVAVTIPSAGNIRITNNSGAAVTFFYAITVIAG